jgi:hypothetical protein
MGYGLSPNIHLSDMVFHLLKGNTYCTFVTFIGGVALNWITNELYFTDEGLNAVGVVDLLRLNSTTLINTGLDTNPRAIVLDPYAE